MKIILANLITGLVIVSSLCALSGNEIVRLDPSAFENPRRPGAAFDHDDHNETAGIDTCSQCHHIYEDGLKIEDESSEDASCSDCHLLIPDSENTVSLQVAFHKQCKGCHFEVKKGPVLCGECHIKS